MKRVERTYRNLGDRLRMLRHKADLSQAAVADLAGLSRASIVNIEAGRQRVLLHDVKWLASAVGATPEKLLRGIFAEKVKR